MSEAQFEEFLKREARDYRQPPAETPRDAMWAAIAEAREARRAAAAATPGLGAAPSQAPGGDAPADVTPIGRRRPTRRLAPWIGMAATLVLGIGIGRMAWRAPTITEVPSVDADAVNGGAVTGGVVATAQPTTSGVGSALTSMDGDDASVAPPRRGVTQLARAATPATAGRQDLPAATVATPSPSLSLVSRDHLQRAEALVSVVAQTPADAVMDSLTGRWAREMLVNTRLLLDSPAGDDPARRRLLEDLETVLVQLVQRSGAAAEERALLDRTLERTQLLTRLRSGAAGI